MMFEMKTVKFHLKLVIVFTCIQSLLSVDDTLVAESKGTAVVQACIAKLSNAGFFTSDEQLIRRIAYVETHDGEDSDTYSDSNNDGGIWQLSSSKYDSTKTSVSSQLLADISSHFGITWSSTTWSDLRKPFYSALAARLYLEVIVAQIPLSIETNGQASYWVNYYTSSGGSTSDYTTAVNYLNANENCEVSGLDLFFVMDASGSVGSANFQVMKSFVYDIVNSFDVGSDSVRVGVMSYGSSYTFHFYLNTYSSKSSVLSAVNNLPYSGGGTNTANALNVVRTTGFTTAYGARPTSQGIPRIAIVITDGKSNSFTATVSAATAMHDAGIIGFAIGIAGANTNELNAIASDLAYVAFISSFNSNLLSNLQVTISQEACVVSPDLTPSDEVVGTIETGEVQYVNYPLPSDNSGITVQIDITTGSCIVYASSVVQTPNEAFHDAQFSTDGWEDVYIDPNDLSNSNTADKVYIAIESKETSSFTLSIDNGDTSTEPANIAVYPSTVSDYFGAEVIVQCFASGNPLPTVNWYKDGILLSTNGKIVIVETSLSNTNISKELTISSLKLSHEGTYTCFGSNTLPNGTVSDSKPISVVVQGIIAVNFTGTALSSTAIYLSWDVPIIPGIVIQYYLVECDELETSRDWSFFAVETHANIISLHPHYSYSCRIQVVGNETYPFNTPIIVYTHQAAPTAAPQNPSSIFFSSNSSHLNLTWYPPPIEKQNGIIQYYEIDMTEIETNAVYEYTSNTTYLFLTTLHAYYSYTFKMAAVTISQGPFSYNFTIQMPEDAPSAPPSNISVVVIDSKSIDISWLPPPFESQNGLIRKYEISIDSEDGIQYTDETQNISITITYLHPNYQYNITVSALTILKGVSSQIIYIVTLEDVPSKSPMMFNGSAISPYSATLTWGPPPSEGQNGVITGYVIQVTVLETNEMFLLYTSNTYLEVNTLRPFRTYFCVIAAQTVIGDGPFGIQFVLKTPEDAPSAPPILYSSSLSLTSRSFYINWGEPDLYDQNGVIKYYMVVIIEIETGIVFQYTEYSNFISVTSLHPAYTYEFTIAAFTVGLGPYSSPFNITTAEEVPSDSPKQFSGISSSSSSVTLTWDPPPFDQQNGIIVSYFIFVTSLDTLVVFNYTVYDTQYTLSNLSPFTMYTCKISAQTSIGSGPSSVLITVTTNEDAPNVSPVITVGYSIDSSTVAIQWDPILEEDRNGIIREYRVLTVNLKTGVNQTYIFTTMTAIIGSLNPSFPYQFSVSAYTIAEGPYSTVINITMPEDVPSGFPQNVNGNSPSPEGIYLSWSPPVDDEQNGEIDQYIVNVTHADTLETIQYFSNLTFIYITGLDPYTTYVCVVAAETGIGIGPFSNLYFIQTQEDSPDSAPLHASGVALGSTSIHITWDPPAIEDHNGVIREYRVNITHIPTQFFVQQTTNQTQIIIENLSPYHIYHCYIVAITVDEGPYTNAITVLTNEAAPSASPLSVSITVVDSKSLFMTWFPPPVLDHNGIIRSYLIKISTNSNMELSFSTQLTVFNTSVLKPYTSYSVQVAAVTVDTGPFSLPQNVTTQQDVPSSSPREFNASSQSSTTLQLSWLPPTSSDINGVIQFYNLSYTEIETGTFVTITVTTTSTVVNNLHPFYLYKFSVSAVTIGVGPSIPIAIQMPEAAPSLSPTNVLSNNVTSVSIELTWDSIPFENQNGIIRYYLVNVTEEETNINFELFAYSSNLIVQDLHPYYTYHILVAAFTIDKGPYSMEVIYQLDEDVPSSPPTDLIVSVLNSTEAYLNWNSPPVSEQNGVIIRYTVNIVNDYTNKLFTIDTSSTNIIIESLSPYTIYRCSVTALTSIGIGPFTSYVYFETDEDAPSSPPEQVTIDEVTSTEITVSWNLPLLSDHNGIIRSYDVKLSENETNTVTILNTVDPMITITSLHPYYLYEVSVAAVTIERGPFSSILSVTTNSAAPSSAPTSTSAVAINSTALHVFWNLPPIDQINGVIEYYSIRLHISDTTENFNYETSETLIFLTNLHPYYTYTVFVAAVTVSIGPYSEGITVQTPADIPAGAPLNVSGITISSSKIEVSWDPPQFSLQNGPILSYTITVFELTTNVTTQVHQDFLHSTIILTGLHPHYEYLISVAAYTVGLGPSSNISIITLEDVPSGPPNNIQVMLTSSMTATLEWTEPNLEDQNGIIKYYVVTLSSPDGENTLTSSGLVIELTDLHPYYTYTCNVQAFTINPGPNSNITFTTPEDVPSGSPSSLSSSSITSTGVQLSWSSLSISEQNGIIVGYAVHLVEIYSDNSWNFTTNTTSLSVLATLTPHTAYKFAVAAKTVIGTGPFSDYVTFTSREDSPVSSPRDVSATLITSTSFTLTWLPPIEDDVNGIITGYIVSVIVNETQESLVYNTTTTNLTISQLHPFYIHHCSVSCVTIASGPYSIPTDVQTLQDAPSGTVESVTVTAPDSQTVGITWNPLPISQINGIIQYYIIHVSIAETLEMFQNKTVQTMLTLTNAHPHYTYSVIIAAVTITPGPYTSAYSVTTPQDAPSGSPLNLIATVLNSTAVYVTWSQPDLHQQNGVIQKYIITVLDVANDFAEDKEVTGTSFVIHNLHPYYDYDISVSAFTIAPGPDAVASITTNEDVPSSGPINISVSDISSTSLSIHWSLPPLSEQNGVIRYYLLSLLEIPTNTFSIFNTTDLSLSIEYLHPNYEYSFNITAVTIGPGIASIGNFKLLEDIPATFPENISLVPLNYSALYISWNPLKKKDQNGMIKFYRVMVTDVISNYHLDASVNNTSVVVSDLKPFHTYEVQVAAHTIGLGPYSLETNITMPQSVPVKPPTEFVEFLETNLTVHFSWVSPPSQDINGNLLGYQLVCSALNQHVVALNVSGVSVSLHSLQSSTHYTCTVCAYTFVGCGPNAVLHISTYEESLIGPPTSILANVSATSIELEWTSPFDPYIVIIGYGISYQIIETPFLTETPRPPVTVASMSPETLYTIESLLVNTVYRVVMFAVYDEGTGPVSEEITVRTLEKDEYNVKNFECISHTYESLSCSWIHPDTPAGYYIFGYELMYRLADGFDYYPGYGTVLNSIILSPMANEYDINGLLPYGGYILELRCTMSPDGEGSGLGPGELQALTYDQKDLKNITSISSVLSITQSIAPKETVEEFRVEVESATSVDISWKPPSRAEWNGRLESYSITGVRTFSGNAISKRASDSHVQTFIVMPQANHPDPSLASEPLQTETYRLNDLEENFDYNFFVEIVNSKGSGSSTDSIMQTMPESAPSGPPENITAIDVTTTSITIEWKPPNPLEANGFITMYSLNFTRLEIQDTVHLSFKNDVLSYRKQGLHVYENLTVSIAAMTAEGWGPYSVHHYFTTLEDEPSIPTDLKEELVDGNSVILTWKPPVTPNGLINSYQIIYSGRERTLSISDGPYTKSINSSDRLMIQIPNLVKGYFYEFKIRARNGAGYGANNTILVSVPASNTTTSENIENPSEIFGTTTIAVIAVSVALGIVLIIISLLTIICIVKYRCGRSKNAMYQVSATNPARHRSSVANETYELPLQTISSKTYVPTAIEGNEYEDVTFHESPTQAEIPDFIKPNSNVVEPEQSEDNGTDDDVDDDDDESEDDNDDNASEKDKKELSFID